MDPIFAVADGGGDVAKDKKQRSLEGVGKSGQSRYARGRQQVSLPAEMHAVAVRIAEHTGEHVHVAVQRALIAYAKRLKVECPDEPIEPPRGRPVVE